MSMREIIEKELFSVARLELIILHPALRPSLGRIENWE